MRNRKSPVGVVGTLQLADRAAAGAVPAKDQEVPPLELHSKVNGVVPADASQRMDSLEPGTTASPPMG